MDYGAFMSDLASAQSELASAHEEVAARVGGEQYLLGISDLLAANAKREEEVARLRDRFAALWELEAVG